MTFLTHQFENSLYMLIFILIAIVTNIIFMNFIIAEVGASYNKVCKTLNIKLLQERGSMINEAQDMLRARFGEKKIHGWKHLFPNYLIKREEDV
jgi:hypothetical protein